MEMKAVGSEIREALNPHPKQKQPEAKEISQKTREKLLSSAATYFTDMPANANMAAESKM
jgi:hypothetical protein